MTERLTADKHVAHGSKGQIQPQVLHLPRNAPPCSASRPNINEPERVRLCFEKNNIMRQQELSVAARHDTPRPKKSSDQMLRARVRIPFTEITQINVPYVHSVAFRAVSPRAVFSVTDGPCNLWAEHTCSQPAAARCFILVCLEVTAHSSANKHTRTQM